jgi:hypothetical protein
MNKRWAKINGKHKVSDHGEVMWGDRYVKPKLMKGRLIINFADTSKCVHRLVAEHFVDNPGNHAFVKHIDGNFQNNHYTNLKWAPREEHDYICKKCCQQKDPKKFRVKNRPKTLSSGVRVTYKRQSRICSSCEYKRKKKKQFYEIHNQFKNTVRVLQDGNPVQGQQSPGGN